MNAVYWRRYAMCKEWRIRGCVKIYLGSSYSTRVYLFGFGIHFLDFAFVTFFLLFFTLRTRHIESKQEWCFFVQNPRNLEFTLTKKNRVVKSKSRRKKKYTLFGVFFLFQVGMFLQFLFVHVILCTNRKLWKHWKTS